MDEVERRIAELRKHLASTICLTADLESNHSFNMTDYNDKVDLRPTWMLNGSNHSDKPHVDSVLQPEQRNRGIPRSIPSISPEQLKNVELRKVENKVSADINNSRARESSSEYCNIRQPIPVKPPVDPFRYQTYSPQDIKIDPPPPPPPPQLQPQVHHTPRVVDEPAKFGETARSNTFPSYKDESVHQSTRMMTNDNGNQIMDLLDELRTIKIELNRQKLEQASKSQELREKPPTYKSVDDITESDSATVIQKQSEQRIPINNNHEFDKDEILKSPNMKKWLNELVEDRFERASRLDNHERAEPGFDVEMKHRSRSRSKNKRDTRNKDHSRDSSRNSRASRKPYNFRNDSVDSMRSTARSIKSVLFKGTEEEELHSEVDEEDVANPDQGDIGLVDNVSRKFTIHGPFVDRELNVFHAICVEYQLAARMSFAKRTPFSRTNPAHERVYALIGSNRRSSWTNMNSWEKASNDLQVLDFIFQRVIRSRSRKIRKPVMELEHFSEGSILDSRRFYSIMHSVFKKREHLLKVLGVVIDRFTDIK